LLSIRLELGIFNLQISIIQSFAFKYQLKLYLPRAKTPGGYFFRFKSEKTPYISQKISRMQHYFGMINRKLIW